MHAALVIAAKDLRQRIRDASAIIFGVVAPLGLAIIFSSVFGGAFSGELDLSFAAVDEDGGELATVFTDEVLPRISRAGLAETAVVGSAADARAAVTAGDLTAAFVLPEGFSAAARSGEVVAIEVFAGADADIGTAVAEGIARSFLAEVRAVQVAVGTLTGSPDGVDPATVLDIAEAVVARDPPLVVGTVTTATAQLDPETYLSAGMAIFFLFFTVQFGVTSLLEERRDGTLGRLLSAPIAQAAVYGGKALTSLLLGVMAMTILIVASTLLIGATWGDARGVALLVIAGVVAATAIMAFIAAMARTVEQANTWQSIVAVVLGMLGGTFFPVSEASGLLASVSLLTPHRWFMRGLAQLAGGGGPAAVLPSVAAMLVFAVAGFGLAAIVARGREGLV